MTTPEGRVVQAICAYLQFQQNAGRCFYHRVRNMSYNAKAKCFIKPKGLGYINGIPDIIAVAAPTGRIIGIECKAARGVLNEDQKKYKAHLEAVGGVLVARGIQDVELLFTKFTK